MQPPRASAKQTGEPANGGGGGGKENNAGQRSLVRRTLAKLDTKRSHLRHKLNKRFRDNDTGERSWDNMEYSERQNSVATLDLFKYASRSERLAVLLGVLLMWYAASWQPISVFILAIMASLMGQYSKRISWLLEQTENKTPNVSLSVLDLGAALQAPSVGERSPEPDSNYESFQLLSPLYSIVTPIFELSHEANQSSESDEDILRHESRQFLRKSFEINGSAFVLALSQLAAFFLGLTLITWIARRQASRVKVLYFDSCLHQEVTWFEAIDSASGSGSSLNGLVERYEDGIGIKLALLCYFIGHVALFAVSAFCQMFQLASFCMPFVLAVGLIIGYLGERQAAAIGQHSLFAKRSLQLAEEIVAAIRTVFAFNGQQKEITRYGMSLEPVYRRSLMKHLYTALNTSISKFSIFACFACYCFYARRLFPPFQPAPPDKSTVLAVMRGAEVSIVNILISIPFMEALQQAKGSIARIYAAIERRSKIDPAAERGTRPAAAQWQPSISFKMVQFGYAHRSGPTRRRSTLPFLNLPGSPGSNGPEAALPSEPNVVARRQSLMDELAEELPCQQPRRQSAVRRIMGSELAGSGSKRILNYFTLDIRAGQSVALVGPSGSGKSTVLALVQRLYDITGGQLLVGQHNVKDLNVSWLRNQIGVVGQEPRLFDMSIADNIRLGLSADQPPSKSASMQQVVEAARLASAHDFIQRLPHGYATRVGSGGVQLSGGQKQRIAIARALIRRPKILLLDEATSALDTESEAQVQEALKAASRGRTTLTVAHRLATIRHVDLIVLMNRGQVMECGSHDELMRRTDGLYRKMYLDQLETVERPARDPPSVDQELSERLLRADQKSPGKLNRLGNFEFPAGEPPDLEQIELDSDSDSDDDNDEQDDDKDAKPKAAAKMKAGTWELWRFLEMPKWSSSLAALVCLLAGLVLPMNLIAHSYLFSAFAYSEPEQLGAYLHLFGVVILSFSFFVLIVTFLQITLPGYVGEKLNIHLRIKTLQALLSKPMFYFDMDANSAGSLCDRFNTHICTLQSLAGTRVATLLEASSTLAAGAVFGLGQSLSLSLFCLSFALLVLATTIVESRIVERESSLQQKYDAQLAHLMADALSNIKTIATLNKERFFIDKFADIIRQRERGLGRPLLWLRTFLTSLKFVMPAMSWSASMYYGCHLLVEGRIDLQTIFVVCPVVLFAVNDTFRALVFLPELLRARKSIQRLYRMNREFSPEVLQTLTLAQQLEQQNELHLQQMAGLEPGRPSISVVASQELEPADGPRKKKSISFAAESRPSESPTADLEPAAAAPQQQQLNRRLSSLSALPSYMRRKSSRLNSLVPRAQARGRIEFRQVEFAYPNRPSALVLDGLTLSVAPGESVALVGGSGSGKSTCVSILEKFYDYHAGSVTLDGRDLRLMEPSWVRSQIGLVSQEPTLLSYTIGDNIRYGDNSRFVSMDEVVEAARTANIHDFIMSLPDQYDTELSSSVYSSSQLSGGQRQRIAIARALVRNAPILVFDEATSALDSRNETLVQDALSKARKGRTSLTIAHRLATVRDAHKIVVLRDGRAIELGTHEQLMAKPDGHYRALWERQEGAGNVPGEGGR